MPSRQPSVLIIGATGKTGLAIVQQLHSDPSNPKIHVLARDVAKVTKATEGFHIDTVIEGNARNESDIQSALSKTGANWIAVAVGNGENLGKNDIRTANANAIVKVLQLPQFQSVKAMVISSTGAGGSRIVVGMGIGKLIEFHLRHVLKDHTGQEHAFSVITNRTTVVRATALTDDQPTGNLVTFGDTDKSPSIKTDRKDLATWVVGQICNNPKPEGTTNLTGVKSRSSRSVS